MKLLVLQSSVVFCYFIPLTSKYSPKHPVFKHPQFVFFPYDGRSSYTPTEKNRQIFNLYVLRQETKSFEFGGSNIPRI